jgi:hypothetical protein
MVRCRRFPGLVPCKDTLCFSSVLSRNKCALFAIGSFLKNFGICLLLQGFPRFEVFASTLVLACYFHPVSPSCSPTLADIVSIPSSPLPARVISSHPQTASFRNSPDLISLGSAVAERLESLPLLTLLRFASPTSSCATTSYPPPARKSSTAPPFTEHHFKGVYILTAGLFFSLMTRSVPFFYYPYSLFQASTGAILTF